ncbi:54S ribosomal protein RTC6, mitochondrial [Coccinella septempunctata]|uniref:54S ribosomal protein RTC6, mitochondrial n=1 Tax=Coccinella septempunctata TaxID=41139 RepID=UPI001D08D87C|nr:54S ribosomal protein RTC6, mitochondrial [Coccinella septempunctata]
MFSILRSTLSIFRNGSNIPDVPSRLHHLLMSPVTARAITPNYNFLAPTITEYVSKCGFKVKGLLRKRCKDCFFVVRDEGLHVVCKTHRRHKQMAMRKKPRNTWILSHATQGKVRPW